MRTSVPVRTIEQVKIRRRRIISTTSVCEKKQSHLLFLFINESDKSDCRKCISPQKIKCEDCSGFQHNNNPKHRLSLDKFMRNYISTAIFNTITKSKDINPDLLTMKKKIFNKRYLFLMESR